MVFIYKKLYFVCLKFQNRNKKYIDLHLNTLKEIANKFQGRNIVLTFMSV